MPIEPTVVFAVRRPLWNGPGIATFVGRHDDDETFRRDMGRPVDHVGGGDANADVGAARAGVNDSPERRSR